MSSLLPKFNSTFALALAVVLAVKGTSALTADDTPTLFTVGIEGHCRTGCWTGIRNFGNQPISSIETRDGDGVRVQYRQSGGSSWSYAVPGSEAAPLVIHSGEDVLGSTRFPIVGSPARGAAMIPGSMRWVIALGDPLGIDTIGANELLGRDATIAVSQPRIRFIATRFGARFRWRRCVGHHRLQRALLAALTPSQCSAIGDWIHDGGYLLLTLGRSSDRLMAVAPWLLELLPIDQLAIETVSPSALETFTSTQTPLDTFSSAMLPKDEGRVLLMGRTTRRVSTPLAVEYGVGFGKILVIAADLDDESFAPWPERLDLITQLTGQRLVADTEPLPTRQRATAYDDLAGQLRGSLDRFSTRRGLRFSILSLILLALIAAIGPLDYLLVNRLLGRPLLGWITFPLVVIGLSITLIWQSRPIPVAGSGKFATDLERNQIEIFDLDSIAGMGRGFAATYFYTHDACRLDLDVAMDSSLRSISDGTASVITSPLGYPGQAFGGIPIAIEDTRLPTYGVLLEHTGDSRSTSLVGLPIASRSSKGLVSRCWFKPKLAKEVSMYRRPGSELLQGELINPLPLDLLGGMLIFRNWAYLLPTRFPAGGRVASVGNLRQKNFRWQLARQQALEASDTRTEAWDPAKVDSLDRIAEMLMFHGAAGGAVTPRSVTNPFGPWT